MKDRDASGITRGFRRGLAICVIVCAGISAADAQTPRGGGLVPTPRKTRAELVREWDLNSDGKIDKGEAEVAASRMRRERAEMRLNSGIDPITGLPRGESLPELPEEPPREDVAEEEPVVEEPADERRLPGTRVPRPNPRGSPTAQAEPDAPAARATDGTRAAADRARQPVTGGVRAGGLPARAGYGAGIPAAPLNAGLPIAPRTRPTPEQPRQPRGGLLPTSRPAPPAAPAPPRPAASRDLYDPY
jgi:hypothetical protein